MKRPRPNTSLDEELRRQVAATEGLVADQQRRADEYKKQAKKAQDLAQKEYGKRQEAEQALLSRYCCGCLASDLNLMHDWSFVDSPHL